MNIDLNDYPKINSILKLKEFNLKTPSTIFINDLKSQKTEFNNFLLGKELLMVRSEIKGKSTHCPRNLKCTPYEAKKFVEELNKDGYVAIIQNFVPLNNIYSGNILVLKDSFIIELMHGGPVSKLNRDGVLHEHLRLDKKGNVTFHFGEENVIPKEDINKIIKDVSNTPNYHILEFSKGPDWFYYWQARYDLTSKKLE